MTLDTTRILTSAKMPTSDQLCLSKGKQNNDNKQGMK